MRNLSNKIFALVFFIVALHLIENNEREQGAIWLIVKIIIIALAYILFRFIQRTQIYNKIKKIWRNHIAFLIRYKKRRKILMPFKNACLQFSYSFFWFIVAFLLYMSLSITLGIEKSEFASYCFMLISVYIIGVFWHISSIIGNLNHKNKKS